MRCADSRTSRTSRARIVLVGALAVTLGFSTTPTPVRAGDLLDTVEMDCPLLHPSDVGVIGVDTIVVGPEENAEAPVADFLVCRIEPSGTAVWTRTIAGFLRTEAVAVSVGPNGVYVGGNYLDDGGWRHGRIQRLGRGGKVKEHANIRTDKHDTLWDVAAAPDGRVYATGSTEGDLRKNPATPTNPSPIDAFVRAFDADLDVRWTRQFRGTKTTTLGSTSKGFAWGTAIAADETGIFVTGVVRGALPGWDGTRMGDDAFVRRYSLDGTARWTDQFNVIWSDGLEGDPVELDVIPADLALSAQGVHVVGSSQWLGDRDVERRWDAFQRVYSRTGTPRWTTELGGWNDDGAIKVVTDAEGSVILGFAPAGLGDPGDDSSIFLARFGSSGSVESVVEFQPDGWWLDLVKIAGNGEVVRIASVIAAPLSEPAPDGLVVPPVGTNLILLNAALTE